MNTPRPTLRILGFLAALALIVLGATWLTQPRHVVPPSAPMATMDRATPSVTAAAPAAPGSGDAAKAAAPSLVPVTSEAPSQAGMVVGIDPETGKIGAPTPEQRAELDQISASQGALLSRSAVGLVEEHRADGTVHVNLQGRFQDYATVRIGPDGRRTFGCVEDTTGLSKSANGPEPGAPALEER